MPRSEPKRVAKAARRRRAAKAVLSNQPITAIARSEGVSSKTIQRDLRERETRLLLVELAVHHDLELRAGFAQALAVARQAMAAEIVEREGKKTTSRPDWPTRLRGTREFDRLLRTVTIGRLFEPEQDPGGLREGLQWDEFLVMRARYIAKTPAKN